MNQPKCIQCTSRISNTRDAILIKEGLLCPICAPRNVRVSYDNIRLKCSECDHYHDCHDELIREIETLKENALRADEEIKRLRGN